MDVPIFVNLTPLSLMNCNARAAFYGISCIVQARTSAFSTRCIFFLRVYLPNVSPDMISKSCYQLQQLH